MSRGDIQESPPRQNADMANPYADVIHPSMVSRLEVKVKEGESVQILATYNPGRAARWTMGDSELGLRHFQADPSPGAQTDPPERMGGERMCGSCSYRHGYHELFPKVEGEPMNWLMFLLRRLRATQMDFLVRMRSHQVRVNFMLETPHSTGVRVTLEFAASRTCVGHRSSIGFATRPNYRQLRYPRVRPFAFCYREAC